MKNSIRRNFLKAADSENPEMLLRESEALFRSVYESNIIGIFFGNKEGDTIVEANDAFLDFVGYDREDLRSGLLRFDRLTLPEQSHLTVKAMEEAKTRGFCTPYEKDYICKDGSRTPAIIGGAFLKDSRYGGVGFVLDNSERTKAEAAQRESEERFRHLFEHAADAVFVTAMDTKFVDVNQRACDSLGYTREEILSMFVADIDKTIALEQLVENRKRMFKGEFMTINGAHTRKDGTTFPVEVRTSVFESNGQNYVLSIARDITERKRAEEQIKSSLNEKEVLIKEIHHRVKNNLQIISSLLNIQAQYIKDGQALEMFNESQNRIRSMALIHEKLYKSKDFVGIDFSDYINSLMAQLFRAYKIDSDLINLKIDIEYALLDVDTALPCGLIINELVSNSIKYAFPNAKRGSILISLRHINDENFLLSVSDDGIGLPEDFDLQNAESLGLQLVGMLASQLGGKVEIRSVRGAEFKIFFKMLNNY